MQAQIEIFDFIKVLREQGLTEKAAETIAKEIMVSQERTIKEAKSFVENKELATKGDIKIEIEKLRTEMEKIKYDTLKFIVWTGVGVVLTLVGFLAKGFHWI